MDSKRLGGSSIVRCKILVLIAWIGWSISKTKLEDFVEQEFYQPMGLKNIHFLPRQHFSIDRIVPTEYDSLFRKQLIRGDVHDPGAAMLGGVGGHAGLFSNATDLASLMQFNKMFYAFQFVPANFLFENLAFF